jgi:hypothetical protein
MMLKLLMSTFIAVALVAIFSVMARAQSHPMYDSSTSEGESRPIYYNLYEGSSSPIYDNTIPAPVGSGTAIGRSINNLNSVISDLNQTPPDGLGRRNRALDHANVALQELRALQQSSPGQ